jgi:aspartate aminotransferase-like enzyme
MDGPISSQNTQLSDSTGSEPSPRNRSFLESMSAMNKRQLIDDIRRYNTTVPTEFLSQFDESALKQYLEHLEGARNKHARIASWVRKTPKLRLVS